MTKVNANHAAGVEVDHEVGQVAVPDASDVVRHTQEGVRGRPITLEGEVGLRSSTQTQIPPSKTDSGSVRLCGHISIFGNLFANVQCQTF